MPDEGKEEEEEEDDEDADDEGTTDCEAGASTWSIFDCRVDAS